MENSNLHMGAAEWALLLLLSVLWGGAFFLIEIAIMDVPPFTTVAARLVLASAVLILYVRLTGNTMPNGPGAWFAFIRLGAVRAFIPFCLVVWGETRIDSNLAAILTATVPIFTMLLAHFFTPDEPLTRDRAAGILLGFCGIIVIIGPEAARGLGRDVYGQLAILGAALSYASSHVYGRRFSHLPPPVLAAGMLTGAAILSLPPALILERPWMLRPDLLPVAAVLGLALLSTALGYLIYFRVLSAGGANNAALVTFFIPLSAIFLGVAVLHEPLPAKSAAGLALVLLGLAVIGNRWRSLFRFACFLRRGSS